MLETFSELAVKEPDLMRLVLQDVREALSIAYVTQEGLVSLLTIWQKLPTRN